MQAFESLGRDLEAAFLRENYEELAFPAIAARALREARVPDSIGADDVLHFLLSTTSLPRQADPEGTFGEPPVTVYHGLRFHIDVLFWYTASTSLHRHGFTGAFQVLEGGSLHSRYGFSPRRRINAQLSIGDVSLLGAELLRRGDVREIERDLTHALFHLEAPSATIVVRTRGEAEAQPQYEYRPPSVAIDPFSSEPTQRRWLEGLHLLLRAGRADYDEMAAALIQRTDLVTAYLVLREAHRLLDDRDRVERLVAVAAERHGPVVDDLAISLREELRRRAIHTLRTSVRDPDRRFFLALVQNLPDRESIYSLVRQRHPDSDPRERVIAWARDLTGVDRVGIDFDDDLNRALFPALLDGCDGDALLARLKTEFAPEDVDAQASAVQRYAARMKKTVLSPLFR